MSTYPAGEVRCEVCGEPMTFLQYSEHTHPEPAPSLLSVLRLSRQQPLVLSGHAISLLSALLDFNDDDEELSENSGASLTTITELRDAVAAAVKRI